MSPRKAKATAALEETPEANTESPVLDVTAVAVEAEIQESPAATDAKVETDEEREQHENIEKFVQLRRDVTTLAASMRDKKTPLPVELSAAEQTLQSFIDRAVMGRNIRVATDEDIALVKQTEGDRPGSLFAYSGVTYFAPGYNKKAVHILTNDLAFISRRLSHAAYNENITSLVTRLNNANTEEDLASAGAFLLREKLITEATPNVLVQHRKDNQVHKLMFWNQRFYTAPFRITDAFREAKERLATPATATSAPVPEVSAVPVASPSPDPMADMIDWAALKASATLTAADLHQDSPRMGLAVFSAVFGNGNDLGDLAIEKSSEGLTVIASQVPSFTNLVGNLLHFGTGQIPSSLISVIERAAGPVPSARPQPRPATPRAATPADTTKPPSRTPSTHAKRDGKPDGESDGAASQGRPKQNEEHKFWRDVLAEIANESDDETEDLNEPEVSADEPVATSKKPARKRTPSTKTTAAAPKAPATKKAKTPKVKAAVS